MTREELLRYGNELTICGFIVGNANEQEVMYFPGDGPLLIVGGGPTFYTPNDQEIHRIIRQMDVQEIEGLQKMILRKSQRNIDTRVSWQVFRRDNFICVYCGADDVPMTVDHIVLWEHMGDSVPDNLNCSCKKCNKTRGSMDYDIWLGSTYLMDKLPRSYVGRKPAIKELRVRGEVAQKLPLGKTKRSR